jgi:hypothetical protein
MEAICSSKMSVDTQRTTRRYIPEDGTLDTELIRYSVSLAVDCSRSKVQQIGCQWANLLRAWNGRHYDPQHSVNQRYGWDFFLCSESINTQLPPHVESDHSFANDASVKTSGKFVVSPPCTDISPLRAMQSVSQMEIVTCILDCIDHLQRSSDLHSRHKSQMVIFPRRNKHTNSTEYWHGGTPSSHPGTQTNSRSIVGTYTVLYKI